MTVGMARGFRQIIQQDRTGCGIACVAAAVAHTTYLRVKRLA